MLSSVAVILPAAGKSSRFGGKEKKPFTQLDGRAVWLRSAELFVTRPEVKQVLIVVAAEDLELFERRYAANVDVSKHSPWWKVAKSGLNRLPMRSKK